LTQISDSIDLRLANGKEYQVAIVTGASSGIGLGLTQALRERGYRAVDNSRTISKTTGLKTSTNLVLVDGDISKAQANRQGHQDRLCHCAYRRQW
jgi:NADP-dependent 3-hydroxy acid dehydrogenase YdfG